MTFNNFCIIFIPAANKKDFICRKLFFAEDYIDCGNGLGCDWSEFIDPDVMEAIVAKQEQTHAQAAIEQAIKKKSLIQRIARSVKSICEK